MSGLSQPAGFGFLICHSFLAFASGTISSARGDGSACVSGLIPEESVDQGGPISHPPEQALLKAGLALS